MVQPQSRGEDPTSADEDYEIIAPVHLLSILGVVPDDLMERCAKVQSLEGERVHVSALIDSTDDNGEINYTREELPWDQPTVDEGFTFGEEATEEEIAKVKELLKHYKTVFSSTLTKKKTLNSPHLN